MTREPEAAVVAGVTVDTQHWIGGERVASTETCTNVSPIDGSVLDSLARDTAMAAAKAAFPGWAATPHAERTRTLHAIADGVENRLEDLAIVETYDNGALLRAHRRGVMPRVAHDFRRHLLHPVTIRPGTGTAQALGAETVEASCYHHQRVDHPGNGLTMAATADDGTIEVLEVPSARGWSTAAQWHPEDTASTDPPQQNLFDTLVRHARSG